MTGNKTKVPHLTVHEQEVFGLFDQIVENLGLERQLNAGLHLHLFLLGDRVAERLNAEGRDGLEKVAPDVRKQVFFALKLLPKNKWNVNNENSCDANGRPNYINRVDYQRLPL